MLILTKKRITIILCMLCVSLYVFSFKISNNMININKEEKTAETVATPVSNKVVIVDAGHGTPEKGGSLLH